MAVNRKPIQAGRFYPRFQKELISQIKQCYLDTEYGPGKELEVGVKMEGSLRTVLGGICPHAGYTFSGPAATLTIQEIFREGAPDTIIILGNQHTGYQQIGLMKEGTWQTPLGKIEIDTEVATHLLSLSEVIRDDDSAFNGYPHGREHNIEVHVPMIQYAAAKAQKQIKFVPIKVGSAHYPDLVKLAKAIADTLKHFQPNKDIAIIASSDMTHFQPRNPHSPAYEIEHVQYTKDQAVIDAFKEFNIKLTFENAGKTSVCGPQTIATLLLTGNYLEYSNTEALKYYTSFDKTGREIPCEYSVGYFSGIVKK